MSLSTLNHDCFLGVLSHIPLPKQMQLRLVSKSWCATIEETFQRRKSLALVCPDRAGQFKTVYPDIPKSAFYYNPDPLYLRTSTYTQSFTLFVRLFPNVQNLLIFAFDLPHATMNLYLSSLTESLTTLASYHSLHLDWKYLATFPNLKRLYVGFSWFVDPARLPQISPVLKQLTAFATADTTVILLSILGPLEHLEMGNLRCTSFFKNNDVKEGCKKVDPQTREALKHLNIGYINAENPRKIEILQLLTETFYNLQSLRMFDKEIKLDGIPQVTRGLANLKEFAVRPTGPMVGGRPQLSKAYLEDALKAQGVKLMIIDK